MISFEHCNQEACIAECHGALRTSGVGLTWVVGLAVLAIPLEAARNVTLPRDPFSPINWIQTIATWGEQKAEAGDVAVNQYRDELSRHYFGALFGQRADKTDYESDTDFEAIHTVYLPDGALMSWWEEANYSWSQIERDYSFRVPTDGGSTLYYYYWDTTYRVFSNYTRSGINPPDPIPATFKMTVTCLIVDVEYVVDSGLTVIPRGEKQYFELDLSAREDDHADIDLLGFGEQMVDSQTLGLWRRYWGTRDCTPAELALIFDLSAKLRAQTQGKPCELEEKIGQD